ncbi:MAG TPA: CoB--CoM heterodisulfide reductase iron-sulfur subunit A family protein [Bryobacteraceae bacterium]|nr:CoB--CoM heterodisulfide reductase iron-sulfur subunit A family protein [Bryobacteraceae bacterium]
MRTGVYFCNCGTNISDRIDFNRLREELAKLPGVAYVKPVGYLCSEDGKQFLETDIGRERPERVVIAACSPREYERAFKQVLERAGMNPYFLQMTNIREQVAWVTPDVEQATWKACAQIRGAAARARLHQPLHKTELDVCRDVVVIGAGPAGLKCALALAEAGRKVVLVEKSPVLGGLPVRYEDLFPNMECGPCLLEPVLGEAMHGTHSANIEILTMAEVTGLKGYCGNFQATLRETPRGVDAEQCMGCGECIPPCPVSVPNEFNFGLDTRHAMALPFAGALPNLPFLDAQACLRGKGEDCTLCRDACPVEDAVRFDQGPRVLERFAGAIVVAAGFSLYDCRRLPELGYGTVPGVYTSLEFERILASSGPTGGELRRPDGAAPRSVAIVHCAGSLDERHRPYCSGICCDYAFKFNHLIEKKLPGTEVHHLYRELGAPGKEEFSLCQQARHNPHARFVRYAPGGVRVTESEGGPAVEYEDSSGDRGRVRADMVVLCPAVTGAADGGKLSRLLGAPLDRFGFFEELHGRMDSAQSRIKGIYLAGACQAPMDIQRAVSQGMSAAGYVLSALADGRKLEIEPITAWVDGARCSGCRTCGEVCPYQAIDYPPEGREASVNALLCHGCGTCVAACPCGAIRGNHFTDEQILAEIQAVLA